MMPVYHGAKTLTLFANSSPSQVVVAEFANSFLYDHSQESIPDLDLKCLSPNGNNELLKLHHAK